MRNQKTQDLKPGDVVIRRPRQSEIAPVTVRLQRRAGRTFSQRPAVVLLGLMMAVIIAGTGVLMLPFASTGPGGADLLTAFFTSASAVTTTGLTLEVTATYWTWFGQWVIAALIFVGGLGFMTGVTFLFLLIGHRLSLPEHLVLRDSLAAQPLEGLVRLARNVLILDVVITAIGVIPLWISFSNYYPPTTALWQAVFHSISAFNTAGFDIVGGSSLAPFATDYVLLGELTAISVLGAISYTVLLQVFGRRTWKFYSLDTKVVITFSVGLWVIGSTLFAAFSLLQHAVPIDGSPFQVGFTAVYNLVSGATTTGFATIDFGAVADSVLMVTIVLMFIGGAAGSTAGGIKVNTFAVLVIAVCSFLRGRHHPEAHHREIPFEQVTRALTVTAVGVAVAMTATLALQFLEPGISAIKLTFEALSALGTVGLSAGVLPNLSLPGIGIITLLMLIGRLGVLSLIVVLAPSERPHTYRFPKEAMKIG